MPSDGGAAWSPPAGSGERRLSNSSDGSTCSGYSKTTSDAGSIDPSRPRVAKPIGARPPANALQFVKVGPCDLYRSAQEQLKRAEAVKKSKEVKKEEAEDWQSNLDNWKSSRRKRVDHIIQRCAEVRRLEAEPQPRAKGKTFNEMMEERAGKRRRCPLTLYPDDEVTDLSDLGIGTSSTKSSLSEDCDTQSLASDGVDLDKNHSDVDNMSNCDMSNRKLESSANEYDTCTTNTISSPEPEEYTYEGAIEGYKSRIISQTHTNIQFNEYTNNNNYDKEKSPEQLTNGDINLIRTTVSTKIEEKLSSFQQNKLVAVLDANSNTTTVKKDLPKVDILKRRELFEKDSSPEPLQNSRAINRSIGDLTNAKPLKERLSSLEKREEVTIQPKPIGNSTKMLTEVKSSIKDRLSSLSRCVSTETDKTNLRLSNGDLVNTRSLKDRLSSFKSQISEDESKIAKIEVKEVSQSLKQRLTSLEAARNKEVSQTITEKEIVAIPQPILNTTEKNFEDNSGLDTQMQTFCRSLDSLDINEGNGQNHFERVQSFEDFEICGESNNVTIPSDIETEDSGVHTAGSCAVSQGDDTGEVNDIANVDTLAEEPHLQSSLELEPNEDLEMSNISCEKLEIVEEQQYSYVEDPIEVQEQSEQIKHDESEASSKEFHQALSHLDDDASATEESTDFQLDKDEMDEDTLKSIDQHDVSVSLHENNSSSSDGDNVVFEGKMVIHLNLDEICNNNGGVGNTNSTLSTTNGNVHSNNSSPTKSYPTVTVSNIFTTTNVSPKNSFNTLLNTSSDSLSSVTNSLESAPGYNTIYASSNSISKSCYNRAVSEDNVAKRPSLANSVTSLQLSNESINSGPNSIISVGSSSSLPAGSSQDSNPFWHRRTRSHMEPNRRRTILHIKNKITSPKPPSGPPISDMPEIVPSNLKTDSCI